MKKFFSLFLLLSVLLIPATGCYAAGPWRGKVIDAETKKPIEGAAVVAVWWWEYAGPAGATPHLLEVKETLTDSEGNFEIPSFWAVSIPLVRAVSGPDFNIYKPGYGSYPFFQISPKKDLKDIFLKEGVKIELPKLKNREERLKSIPSMTITWEKLPTLLKMVNEERENLGLEPIGGKEK